MVAGTRLAGVVVVVVVGMRSRVVVASTCLAGVVSVVVVGMQ